MVRGREEDPEGDGYCVEEDARKLSVTPWRSLPEDRNKWRKVVESDNSY